MKQASILCMALFCALCAGVKREASDFGTDFHVCLGICYTNVEYSL